MENALTIREMTHQAPSTVTLLKQIETFEEKLNVEQIRLPLHHRFRWMGLTLSLEVTGDNRQGTIMLEGAIGKLPYTAENPTARTEALRLIGSINRNSGDRICARPDNQIWVSSHTLYDGSMSLLQLLTALSIILMEMRHRIRPLSQYLLPA